MGLTPAQRKANQRARDKGLVEPYGEQFKVEQQAKAEKSAEFIRRLEEVAVRDVNGTRFKSEARSLTRLLRLYYGQSEIGEQDQENAETTPSKGPKRPNPSITPIRIQNSNLDPTSKAKGNKKGTSEIDYEVNEVVSFERWLDLRDRARKDLFWLGRLLGKGLYRSVHQVICDQFVQKNFGGPWLKTDGTVDESRPPVEPMYFDGYTLDDFHGMIEVHHDEWEDHENVTQKNPYGRKTEMILLDSRGFYKSTIDGIDAVQWLINCPDIRIFIIAGKYDLSVLFMKEIKSYFYMAKGQEPTAFHLLFPEYVLYGNEGTSKEPLDCPARLMVHGGKEPSLWVDSIVSNLSGWHCDIKKGDDVVTDKNSNTEETREDLKFKYDGTDDLLDPHGFMDHIGTRYFTDDWYGTRMKPNKETGECAPYKYFCRGCWTIKPEYRDLPLVSLTEEMVTLTFPQRWGFKRLRALLLKKMSENNSDRAFRNQQMNEPTDAEEDSGFKISFTEDAIRAHMYQRDAAPRVGQVFVVWDWALSEKATSDFSAGVAGRLYKNDAGQWSFTILEIIYDKWKSSELAHQIVDFSRRWGPEVTFIEKSNGADMLKMEIQRVGNKYGYHPYIVWPVPSRQENAKRNRIKGVEIILSEHRLHFVLGSWMDETIKQLTQYTGEKKNKGRKDDIPDAIAMLLQYCLPAEARPVVGKIDLEEQQRIQEEQEKQWRKQAHYDRLFGPSGGTRKHPQPSDQSGQMKLSEWYRTRNNPGGTPPPATPAPAPARPSDPRMVIFGNKGPWRL